MSIRIVRGIFASFLLFFCVGLFQTIFAQSQGDVNPYFDAGSTNEFYVNFNYDCTSLPWPEGAVSTYRQIIYNEEGGEKIPVNVETYYIFQGESFIDIEVGRISDLESRKVPKPIYVSNQVIGHFSQLEPYKGQVICGLRLRRVNHSPVVDVLELPSSGIKGITTANLIPPTLQQLENYAIDTIYILWAFVGIFATVRLIYLGFQFMTNSFSPEKKGELVNQLALWAVGLVGFFLTIPALHFIYNLLDIQTTKCFYYQDGEKVVYDLTLPGFTFFYKDVCTGPYAIDNT